MESGVVLIDKPLEWTSFDVVKKLRYASKVKKIGHAGTLDPLATGLLILCFGKYTKRIEEIQEWAKTYTGTCVLGGSTASYDLETEVDQTYPIDHITPAKIEAIIPTFTGLIEQVPPAHSAVKINGVRAYKYARKGKDVKLRTRQVNITKLDLSAERFPEVDFAVQCSKGTYVRTLVNDIGLALESGAYLKQLRRTAIGDFSVEQAFEPHMTKDEFFDRAFTF